MSYRCEVEKGEEFMHISRIKLVNFRSFIGEHEIEFSKGINFLSGIITVEKLRFLDLLNLFKVLKTKQNI